jgi:hypothetical protein
MVVLIGGGYAGVAAFTQASASGQGTLPSKAASTEMSVDKAIFQVPVHVEIPEFGLSGLILVARAENVGIIKCGGPKYVLIHCKPGVDEATLSIADVNDRWRIPGRKEWVGSFHFWRMEVDQSEFDITIEAIRSDDDNGNPVPVDPMIVKISVE